MPDLQQIEVTHCPVTRAALTPLARQSIVEGIVQVCHAAAHSSAASVAIAKATKTMMLYNKLKIAAAILLVSAAIGTSGWAISRAMVGKQAMLQVDGSAANLPPA